MAKLVGARVYNNANISCTRLATTILTFNSERYDTDSIHNTSTNTDRLTCNTAGKYIISLTARFAADTGVMQFNIKLNATTYIARSILNGTDGSVTSVTVTTIYDLAATNYLQADVYHDAAGALNIEYQANYSPEFMMHRIG